jgi:isopentenyl-diphosphate delta-isomerase
MIQVNLVNEQDEVVGSCDLLDAHRGDGLRHQAISLFLFRQDCSGTWQLLLQQRSKHKIVGAGKWANTLCAHPQPGESHLACLHRRSQEELGFTCQTDWQAEEFLTFPYHVRCDEEFSENEIDHLFLIKLDEQEGRDLSLQPNHQEVAKAAFVDWSKLLTGKVTCDLAPWFALFISNSEIIQKIDSLLIDKNIEK